jgi:hypothetical protein
MTRSNEENDDDDHGHHRPNRRSRRSRRRNPEYERDGDVYYRFGTPTKPETVLHREKGRVVTSVEAHCSDCPSGEPIGRYVSRG